MHNEIEKYLFECTERTFAQRAKRRKENAVVYIGLCIFIFAAIMWAGSTVR